MLHAAASLVVQTVKESGNLGSISESERSLGEENGNPL